MDNAFNKKERQRALKSQRSGLLAELRKNREQKEDLEDTFNALIADEEVVRKPEEIRLEKLAAARNIADENLRNSEVALYSKPTVVKRAVSDDMLKAFGATFATKKGTLPWPVKSRTISKKFGKTRNPIYGTETEHLGVNIVTEPRSEVKVVSDGYVFVVSPISGFGDVVFVNHGGYYTAYGNLSQIDVSKNQVMKAGDRIGLSGVTNSPLGENLFFMVRKDKTNLNPQDWLSKKQFYVTLLHSLCLKSYYHKKTTYFVNNLPRLLFYISGLLIISAAFIIFTSELLIKVNDGTTIGTILFFVYGLV